MVRPLLLLFFCLIAQSCGQPATNTNDAAALLRPLIELAKLATLGDQGTNPRVQKITAILWDTKINGHDPAKVVGNAAELIGWGGTEKGRLIDELRQRYPLPQPVRLGREQLPAFRLPAEAIARI